MERKGRIWGQILTLCTLIAGCIPIPASDPAEVTIEAYGEDILTRAIDPDEDMLKDATIMIFDEGGNLADSWTETI